MDLSLILIFVLAAVGMLAFTQWKKISKLEQGLRSETRALEEKRDDAEKARKDSRERTHELDETKKQLQEARNKLKKRERDETEPREKPKKGKSEREEAAAPAPVIVRISDQELAAEHLRTVQRLEDEITALRSDLAAAKKRDDARARDAERASKMLSEAASAPQAAAAPAPVAVAAPAVAASAVPAAEEAAALRAQLDAMKKVAIDREKDLKREIRRAQDDAKHALRRAANNQALYAVLHGQLELAEDRLAAYKLKYEGAKSIEELRRESKKDRAKKQRDARDQRRGQNGEPPTLETTASELLAETTGETTIPPPPSEPPAPSTIEVSKEDIVSTRPTDSIPPEEAKHDA